MVRLTREVIIAQKELLASLVLFLRVPRVAGLKLTVQ